MILTVFYLLVILSISISQFYYKTHAKMEQIKSAEEVIVKIS